MIEIIAIAGILVGFAIGFITCALFGQINGQDWGEPEEDEHAIQHKIEAKNE